MTGETKARIDSLWDMFWAGGLTNPITVTEQLTYLLFLRMLDERTPEVFGDAHQDCRWHVLRTLDADSLFPQMRGRVFPFLRSLTGGYMQDALFLIPTPRLLARAVEAVDAFGREEGDLMGDIYEYLLSRIAQSGTNGQFRTPRHIIRLMTELTQPTMQDTVCDPAMGSAGFLCAAAQYLAEHEADALRQPEGRRHFDTMFRGFDTDRTMLRIGAMNLLLHDVKKPQIAWADSLSRDFPQHERYTLILANPPFTGTLDRERVSPELLALAPTRKTELLFLAMILRSLQPGGRCAVIVPDGVLFGTSKAHKAIRRTLVEEHRLQAVISMPAGVFRPYAGISASILLFVKDGRTDSVWFYDMHADGFSLDDKRTAVPENDIPDILARFQDLPGEERRSRAEQSFLVPKQELAANGYLLSVSRYRQTVCEAAAYPSTEELLAQLHRTEAEITAMLDALK